MHSKKEQELANEPEKCNIVMLVRESKYAHKGKFLYVLNNKQNFGTSQLKFQNVSNYL